MVVVTILSFEFIATVVFPFYTLSTLLSDSAGTIFQCGQACMKHETCGGVVWDFTQGQSPSCQLVVDPSEAGSAVSASTSAFRLMNYRDDLVLREMFRSDVSWDTSKVQCTSAGLQLLPYPKTTKELALLSIRKKSYANVDVVRRLSDEAYVDGQGNIVPPTTFNWGPGNNPLISQPCLGIGYNVVMYFDLECETVDYDTEIFCV